MKTSASPKASTDSLERTPSIPPTIAPVADNVQRPLWSIMIPAYNCIAYLQEAMESVLAQDLGPERMQIAVIDDCSTDGDVGALVESVSKGRIEYFRHEKNRGSLRSFETCLNRSIGEWVHILHGDDRVAPGFYTEIATLFSKYPEAGAAFTNIAFMKREEIFVDTPLTNMSKIIDDFLIQMAKSVKVQPPAIVVKRSVYEQLGGFFAVHYGEDWEMWTRIAAHFPVAYSPKCLAYYRYLTNDSITLRSIGDGQNVRDIIKVIDIIQQYLPDNLRKQLKKIALRDYSLYCVSLANHLYPTDPKSAFVQARGALMMSTDIKVIYSVLKFYTKDILRYNKF